MTPTLNLTPTPPTLTLSLCAMASRATDNYTLGQFWPVGKSLTPMLVQHQLRELAMLVRFEPGLFFGIHVFLAFAQCLKP